MIDETDDSDDSPEATALLQTLDRLWGGICCTCAQGYTGHEAVMSMALGFKDAPRCLACLASGLARDPVELRDQVVQYIRRKDCYTQAWNRASEREGENKSAPVTPSPASRLEPVESLATSHTATLEDWDAGDMGCGDLVLALRIRLNARPPGSVIRVTARDPAAPVDLPAWCGLTGHSLLSAEHPRYLIRRKES